jgi:serine/threonine protein kinase
LKAEPARSDFKGNDRFIIESTLGHGGMGVVYRARDLQRGSVVALKTMTHVYPEALLLFKKEFRALADIAHPSVVQLYDLFADGDQWFFTMELLEGAHFVKHVRTSERATSVTVTHVEPTRHHQTVGTQRTRISSVRPDGTLGSALAKPNSGELVGNVTRLRPALLALLEGVLAIHASGRLHRDIKPSNVMVTNEGRVVLLDFGVVADLDSASERTDDTVMGTPSYMAPEQARGVRVGPAADFYAVGVMLYEALTGQLPFRGTFAQLVLAKEESTPRRPSEIVAGVPADLEALCMALLDRAPEARPDGVEIMARLRAGQPQQPRARGRSSSVSTMASVSAAFVGREAELSVLRRGVERIAANESVVALVSGASGIGKTTLIQRFLKEAGQTPRALVLSGRCYEREAVPFKGLDSVVDELSRWLTLVTPAELNELLPANAAELLRVFPVLRGVPALEEQSWLWPEVKEPQELRRRAFMALRSLLVAIAKERPLVVYIDDLHWTDVDSVALLEQVMRAPGAPSMLLVGSFRSESLGKSPALGALLAMAERLSQSVRVERIELTPLTYEDSVRLATLSLGEGAEAAPAAIKRIAEESQGLPLFVSELSTWQRSTVTDETGGLISLDAVIRGRVDQLPTEAQALLEVLCIAGGPLPTRVAEHIAGLRDAGSLHARLRVAKLTRTMTSGERELVDIYHGRIRDSLMGRIAGERQRSLHSNLASALERNGGADPGALVEHFLAAGDEAGARRHVISAARAAETGLAFLRAAGLYRQAIELKVDHPRWQLERSVADALLSAGHASEAAAAYASAAHHAPVAERTALRRRAAEHFLKTGGETEGLRLLREALDDVEIPYPETNAWARQCLASNREQLRQRGLRFEPRASVPATELERIDVAFAASSGLAVFDAIRAADYGARHLILALDGGEPIRICRALAMEASGRAAVAVQERHEIEELVRTAERLATHSDDSYAVALARLAAGLVRMFSGQWRAAHVTLDAAEQTMRERCRGVHWELANAVAWSMNALVLSGELKEAALRVPEALREAQERADRFALMHLLYPAAMTRIVADDPDSALRMAREFPNTGSAFSERFTGGHWGSLMASVSAHRYRGKGRLAYEAMEADYPRLEATHFLSVHVLRACTTFERGLCALSAIEDGGDEHELQRLVTTSANRLLADHPRYAPPLGHHLLACLHALRGDRQQALEQLEHAIAGLSDCQMGYLADCAKARRGALLDSEVGRELAHASAERLRDQGVVSVERCLRMTAPGFDSHATSPGRP